MISWCSILKAEVVASLVLAAGGCAANGNAGAVAAQDPCHVDKAAMMKLSVFEFDKTIGSGWRIIGNKDGCEAAAADLIAEYMTHNAVALVNGRHADIGGLGRHQAQLRAGANDIPGAIALIKKYKPVEHASTAIMADATLAFLNKDREGLLKARDQMAKLPMPEGFEESAAEYKKNTGKTLVYHDPVYVIDGFINCFHKPYKEAYSFACRPTAK